MGSRYVAPLTFFPVSLTYSAGPQQEYWQPLPPISCPNQCPRCDSPTTWRAKMPRTPFTISCRLLLPAVALAGIICGVSAAAQEQNVPERPVSFGLGVGAAARNGSGLGALGIGMLDLRTPWRSFGVRFDAAVMSWGGNFPQSRLTTVTTDLVYSHRIGLFAPYLLGGVGAYAEPGRGMVWGVNGGVGTRLATGRIQPFIELRQHVWTQTWAGRTTPLAIGLRF